MDKDEIYLNLPLYGQCHKINQCPKNSKPIIKQNINKVKRAMENGLVDKQQYYKSLIRRIIFLEKVLIASVELNQKRSKTVGHRMPNDFLN